MGLSKGNGATAEWNHRDVYLTHVDRDLGPGFGLTGRPFLASDVRRYLVFYSLLYDRLIVPDASTLYNQELEAAIRYQPCRLVELLDEEVIVPAVRSNVPTFVELEESLRDADTWQARDPDDARRWAEYLDEHVRAKREMGIELAQAGPRFTQLTDSAIATCDDARRAGLEGVWNELKEFIGATREDADDKIVRRTTFYEFADRLSERDASASRSARLMSSALYYRNASELLRITPAMAMPFAATLERMEAPSALRDAIGLNRAISQITTLRLRFDVWDLSAVDAGTVLEIRSERDFERFLEAMADARRATDPFLALEMAERALTEYLAFLNEQLSASAIGRLPELRELRRAGRLVSYASRVGELLIPCLALIVGAPEVNVKIAEFLWKFGTESTARYVQGQRDGLDQDARDAVDRRREERGRKQGLGQGD
jgi:hypothetical protein